MATQWGRKETIIWPPHVPIMSYMAIAGALLCTLFFVWQHLYFSMPPLQQSYITEYIRSQVGDSFKAHQSYRLVYLAGGKRTPRLALPVDVVKGTLTLPNGTVVPVGLSELAQVQGYTFLHRGAEQKLTDASLHRWLRFGIFDGKGLLELFEVSLIEGGICLAVMLWFAVPADLTRFRTLKYGRLLRGPVMMTPQEFNVAQYSRTKLLRFTATVRRVTDFFLRKQVAAPVEGIGFKTTEMKELMRVPPTKEAQHFLFMGDTGAGKTQLIQQIVRQIRDRGESAIIYDPACEFVERFYDEKRGDYILNPLDARCPYWSPTDEMAGNPEAGAIASSLYQPSSNSGKDEFFYKTPAKIFAHLLKYGPDPHQLAAWMADEPTLQELVKGTEMAFFVDRKAAPQGVLSSLGLVAESFRMLPRRETAKRAWNALDWSKKREGWIFITSQVTEREIFRPLTSLWIDTLIMRLLAAPKVGQKKVWLVIDELASLQKLPQLHTAITESRKSLNPLVLGFQGRAQLEDIYGKLAEVMVSQPATKVFMKTTESRAAEWISETLGKVEIERLKETKFDGSRSGKNFTVDRQIEPLVIPSEITGLEDRHAFLKLGNNIARFAFDYKALPILTKRLIVRTSEDDVLRYARTPLGPLVPTLAPGPLVSPAPDKAMATAQPTATESVTEPKDETKGPLQQEIPQRRQPLAWPKQEEPEVAARAGEKNRPAPGEPTPDAEHEQELHPSSFVLEP